ncbi:MAG: zinc ribbon domain-containing protein [Nitrososphaera sp.]|nr:zinc ribbon domain-containing protein [Nitrososphaera sp.]
MVKVFNGRAATDEYMSTHSLTFSTPEMILRKFALWLGDQVKVPSGERQVPRLMLFIEEKGVRSEAEFTPDTNDSFRPTGAVSEMYSGFKPIIAEQAPSIPMPSESKMLEIGSKFCIECGRGLKPNAKFCTKCGNAQA